MLRCALTSLTRSAAAIANVANTVVAAHAGLAILRTLSHWSRRSACNANVADSGAIGIVAVADAHAKLASICACTC